MPHPYFKNLLFSDAVFIDFIDKYNGKPQFKVRTRSISKMKKYGNVAQKIAEQRLLIANSGINKYLFL